jgi:zinc transport system permease protein
MIEPSVMLVFSALFMLSLAFGAYGSFVVWNRMAYFGDTVAHASLLGVALSVLSQGIIPLVPAVAAVAMMVAVLLTRQWSDARISTDTTVGIIAHGALAISLLAIGEAGHSHGGGHEGGIDLEAYLFGDVTHLTIAHCKQMLLAASGVLAVLFWQFRRLLMVTLDADMASVEGISAQRTRLLFTLGLAVIIAASITAVGALLVTAMLIIPAATARYLARNPRSMVLISGAAAAIATLGGLAISDYHHTPAAPTMVAFAVALFLLSRFFHRRA